MDNRIIAIAEAIEVNFIMILNLIMSSMGSLSKILEEVVSFPTTKL